MGRGQEFAQCRAVHCVQWLGPRAGGISIGIEQRSAEDVGTPILHPRAPQPPGSAEDMGELGWRGWYQQ